MKAQIDSIKQAALAAAEAAQTVQELGEVRVRYLGKSGAMTALMQGRGALSKEERPEMGKVLRKIMPKAYILVPGYGAQGGQGKDLVHFFNEDGLGAIVNSSRGIIAAYKQEAYASFGAENFGDASRAAVEAMIADISTALAAK